MTRKLIPLEQVIEDAENEGTNPNHLLVDPDDICEVNPDEILDLEEESEENQCLQLEEPEEDQYLQPPLGQS